MWIGWGGLISFFLLLLALEAAVEEEPRPEATESAMGRILNSWKSLRDGFFIFMNPSPSQILQYSYLAIYEKDQVVSLRAYPGMSRHVWACLGMFGPLRACPGPNQSLRGTERALRVVKLFLKTYIWHPGVHL